jgi:hypothetical protein
MTEQETDKLRRVVTYLSMERDRYVEESNEEINPNRTSRNVCAGKAEGIRIALEKIREAFRTF